MANKNSIIQISDGVADTAAGVSALGFTVTLADIDTIVSIAAGVVAIIAGLAAALYHIKKTRRLSNGEDENNQGEGS